MKEESTSRKVVRNTLFNYLAVFSITIIRLAAMPVIVHGLGNDRFGIYAAIMSIVGYVGLLDLGIGMSLTKFVAEYDAKKDHASLAEFLSTALLLYIGLGAIGAAILVGGCGLLVRQFLQIPEVLWPEARLVVWITAVSLFNGLTLGIFGNLLNGLQRQDIARTIGIANTLFTYGGAIVLIRLGFGLVGFVLFSAVMDLLSFLVQMGIAKRLVPTLPFVPRTFRLQKMRKILNFSFAMFINQLAVRNMGSLDKIVLGFFLPIANVTYYSIGFTVTSFCFRVPAAAVLASMPAASELQAKDRVEAVQELVLRGIKYTGALAVPVFTVVGVLAPALVRLWMGEGYEASARVAQILLFGYFWLVLSSSGMSVMVGIGKPYVNTLYAVAQILLCTGLSVLMVMRFGLYGAAVGSSLAYSIGSLAYLVHSSWIFRIPLARMVNRTVLAKVLFLLAPGVLLLALTARFPEPGLFGVLGLAGTYGGLYGLILLRYGVDAYDIEKISAVLPLVRHLAWFRR